MATESPADGEVTACESGQIMEKLAVGMECLLFPKAVVQTARKPMFSGAANGQERTVAPIYLTVRYTHL